MKKLTSLFFSMQTMGVLLFVFAASIAIATFIENDFGTIAAKALVYNATWFNVLLFLLALNLAGNIVIYKMYKRKKWPVFLFHIAFLIILAGSAITRFVSFEGSMHIREGETSNKILTDETYMVIRAEDKDGESVEVKDKVLFSLLTRNHYHREIKIGERSVHVEVEQFIPNATEVIKPVKAGNPFVVMVAAFGEGRQSYYLEEGQKQKLGPYTVSWKSAEQAPVMLKYANKELLIKTEDTLFQMAMTGYRTDTLLPDKWYPFEKGSLYQMQTLNLVLKEFYPSAVLDFQSYSAKKTSLQDAVVVKVYQKGLEPQTVVLRGGKGYEPEAKRLDYHGVKLELSYGSQLKELPFFIKLVDFQLETYPGSNSPSSYASEIILIDREKGVEKPYRIYMNHVLNHRGYRFFQSSYDPDLKGTVLSVNHDAVGTAVTYIGYFLMSLGMFFSVFNKNTRFGLLGKILKKGVKAAGKGLYLILLVVLLSSQATAQHWGHKDVSQIDVVKKQEAEAFGKLLVQSHDGRVKPVNTLASEILRKVTKKAKYEGLIPEQVLLGMVSDPLHWQQIPMIKIRFGVARDKELMKILGVDGDYAAYLDFIDMQTGEYKLGKYVSEAYNKKPAQRSLFDKDIMKADEKINICYMIYTGELLRLLPDPTDSHKPWYALNTKVTGLAPADSLMISKILPAYFNAIKEGNDEDAAELREGIQLYQQKFGREIIPSESKIEAEILYNRWMIFDNLSKGYGLLGMIMMVIIFINLFKNSQKLAKLTSFLIFLALLGFILQTIGLGLRWYISGHAPWSDGYESMIYIGWITMLAGLLFAKQSPMTVAATTILTSVILMVAHLTWMEPEITNLVPVLKSYWLTIHVSVITASYGFLALSMLLGFINLILMILKKDENRAFFEEKILELTIINERSMTIGLYMLTIGTFLGGVWANESWGRYWGWDPKETWALVSVLVYTFVLHMRFIPAFKGVFTFNFASVISYFSIIMTYFGVNFYLSGLHSYAKGDPVPIPGFIYYTLGIIAVVSIWAYLKEERIKKLSGGQMG